MHVFAGLAALPSLGEVLILLGLAYALWALFVAVSLIMQRHSPVATLGWLLALLALPYVGILIWVFFGPRRVRRRRLNFAAARQSVERAAHDIRRGTLPADVGEEVRTRYRQLMLLAATLRQPPPSRATGIELYFGGDECYRAIESAVAAARRHIHIEYYIWEPGELVDRILDRLCERARAGVEVKVLVDDVGSGKADAKYFARLTDCGGQVCWFNPLRFSHFRPTMANFRTHRKIVVCDGLVAFTGGMNLSAVHSVMSSGDIGWRDTHMRITGAPASALQRVFLEDWYYAAKTQVKIGADYFPEAPAAPDGPLVQIIASGPDTSDYAILRFMFTAITSAREHIRLTTAYFVPDEATLEALKAAALRGVDVQLLVPRKGDSRLVTAAARSYFDELTRAGIKVFEYGPPMLHAKTLSTDGALAIVGTANTDNRSFRLNFEVVAAVFDPQTAKALDAQFDRDLADARQYKPRYERETPFQRFTAGFARLFAPLL